MKSEYDRLVMKFMNAHAVAMHHKSFRDYLLLCKLDKMKGLDVGDTYLNDKAAASFVKSIANVTQVDVIHKLDAAKYFSITCDGSTYFTAKS